MSGTHISPEVCWATVSVFLPYCGICQCCGVVYWSLLARNVSVSWCSYVVGEFHFIMTSSNGNIFFVASHLRWDRSPVDSPHNGQWSVGLMFYLICGCTNGWVNNLDGDAGDLRLHRAHHNVTVMWNDNECQSTLAIDGLVICYIRSLVQCFWLESA